MLTVFVIKTIGQKDIDESKQGIFIFVTTLVANGYIPAKKYVSMACVHKWPLKLLQGCKTSQ